MVPMSLLLWAAFIGGVLIVISRMLVWLEGRRQRHFSRSSDKIAIGFPVSAPGTRGDADRTLLSISMEYRVRFGAIKRVKDEFGLSKSLLIKQRDGSEFLLREPNKFLNCDVVLGGSLAGAGYTPGSAIYWLPIAGGQVARAFARQRDATSTTLQTGPLQIDAEQKRFAIKDNRKGAIPIVEIHVGTPIVLRLDEESEKRMQRTLEDEAPRPGEAKKVRLFGGLRQVDGKWMIIPLRQEAHETAPSEGQSLHPLEGLLGVVVAHAQHKAFEWSPPLPDAKGGIAA